jgi:addiction module HigA family antidote
MSKSLTTTKFQDGDKLQPIHPGEILRTEFLEPLNLSATKLAIYLSVPASRITAIISDTEKRAITADTALRLSFAFKTSPEFWLNLQSNYDVAMLEYTGRTEKIRQEVRKLAQV